QGQPRRRPRFGTGIAPKTVRADISGHVPARLTLFMEVAMRSLFLSFVLGVASLGMLGLIPSEAQAQWRWRYGPAYQSYYYPGYYYPGYTSYYYPGYSSFYYNPGYTTYYYPGYRTYYYYPGYTTYYYRPAYSSFYSYPY